MALPFIAYVCANYDRVCIPASRAVESVESRGRRHMGVTSRDVARLAGVSQPTVSRALRDDPRVSEETKQRVREAAALLNYVPSDVGRALSSGRTHRIGLLVTDLDNEFYAHITAPM